MSERKRKTVSESVCNIQIKIERGRAERKCVGEKMNLREREIVRIYMCERER